MKTAKPRGRTSKTKKTGTDKMEIESQGSTETADFSPHRRTKKGIGGKFWFLVLVAIAGYFGYRFYGTRQLENFKNKVIPDAIQKVVNSPDMKIKEISEVKKRNGVYEFKLVFEGNEQQKYTSYITTDGKLLFQSAIELDNLQNSASQGQTAKKLTCEEVEKTDKPQLTAFVVADCPYGLQMQRVLKKTITELPQIAGNIKVRYIGSIVDDKIQSMHGDKEAQENLRQICIREEQAAQYWPYVSCYMKEGKFENCLSLINKSKLDSCVQDKDRGLKFAQEDFDLANKFQVGGSPTLLINEKQMVSEFDFGGRVPNSIKEIVCCGASQKPSFCSKEISKDEVATSYSIDDKPAPGSSSASCN